MSRHHRCPLLAATVTLVLGATAGLAAPGPISIGVNANFEQNLARAANLGWSRIDLVWANIETSQGVFNFSATDSQINYAVSQGQQIIGILHDVPQWLGGGTYLNTPPLNTTEWSNFVGQVAQRYRGKITAYEIWNEPDLKNQTTQGIGWDRDIQQPPLYIDFLHAAAQQIRAKAPGTLVVGPALASYNTATGSADRKAKIFQQIQAANYSDGPGPSFVNVLSFHGNASDNQSALNQAIALSSMNLEEIAYTPSLANAPIWVTEFGWRINAVGQDLQRQLTCEYLRYLTRSWDTADSGLAPYNITRAFFWELIDRGNHTSQVLYNAQAVPQETVTQYMQLLPYPAVQNTVVNGDSDYPSCYGPGGSPAYTAATSAANWSGLSTLGLSDPRSAVPGGFSLTDAQSPGGEGITAVFEDGRGGRIELSAAPGHELSAGFLTDSGARWTNGVAGMTISGTRNDKPLGKAILAVIAEALDPSFKSACLSESMPADATLVHRLGLRVPQAPSGFATGAASYELDQTRGQCSGLSGAPAVFDFTWSFTGPSGEVVRAGAYNFGALEGADAYQADSRSMSWNDANGTHFWVAVDPSVTADEGAVLRELANSLDPSFTG